MKTKIDEFWTRFSEFQFDLLVANAYGNRDTASSLYYLIEAELAILKKGLQFIVSFDREKLKGKLILLPKGKTQLKILCLRLLQEAPILPNWEYQLGIKPFKGDLTEFSISQIDFDLQIIADQLYINILKIYKSSNKLHLEVYVQTDQKGLSKHDLNQAVDNILLWYLGDEYYFTRISRVKIIRRKFKNRNFIPLYALRDFLDYSVLA